MATFQEQGGLVGAGYVCGILLPEKRLVLREIGGDQGGHPHPERWGVLGCLAIRVRLRFNPLGRGCCGFQHGVYHYRDCWVVGSDSCKQCPEGVTILHQSYFSCGYRIPAEYKV